MRKRAEPDCEWVFEDFSTHFDVEDCLMLVARYLGRAGLDVYRLPPFQQELISDLMQPLDEVSLSEMHNYWEYNLQQLVRRGRGYGPKGVPAKPRIDVLIELTSKGNLKAEWFPRGWGRWGAPLSETESSDFAWWMRHEHRSGSYDSRPSNELFFLHEVQQPLCSLTSKDWPRHYRAIDVVLLHACAKVVERLKKRLDHHFSVQMLTDVFVEWGSEPSDDPRNFFGKRPLLLKWEIDDPARRKAEAERAEIERMDEQLGFSREHFSKVWEMEATRKRPTGPAPSPHTLSQRVAKTLRAEGHQVTKRDVDRLMELIAKHGSGKILSFDAAARRASTGNLNDQEQA